jgi:hypothetical protein
MQLAESYVHCRQAGRPPTCCPDTLLRDPIRNKGLFELFPIPIAYRRIIIIIIIIIIMQGMS